MNDNSTSVVVPHVEIYTDGGCEPNPGPGGYGVVLLQPGKRAEASGGFRLTTNNRMEILADIKEISHTARMKWPLAVFFGLAAVASLHGAALNSDLSNYQRLTGLEAQVETDTLIVRWDGERGQIGRAHV